MGCPLHLSVVSFDCGPLLFTLLELDAPPQCLKAFPSFSGEFMVLILVNLDSSSSPNLLGPVSVYVCQCS